MAIKDAFEVLVKIFPGDGTQLMEDASHLNTIIRVGIASIPGRQEQTIGQCTVLAQFRCVIVTIAQDEADFGRNFAQEHMRRFTFGSVGRSEQGSDGKPNSCHDGNDMQLPAVDPPMPPRCGSNALRGQWRYEADRLSRGASDAKRLRERATRYYRAQPLVQSCSKAGPGRSSDDPGSQSEQVMPLE